MILRHAERTALLQVKEYVDNHYSEKITIKDLTKREWTDPAKKSGNAVFFNSVRLQQGFKSVFLQTIHGYQTFLRMEKAKILLITTDLSIKAIAVTVGYRITSKFAPIFKRHFGVTPSKYREEFQE